VLGNLWSGTTDKYGRLSLGAPPADINATSDDAALIAYGVLDMCSNSQFLGNRGQVKWLEFVCKYLIRLGVSMAPIEVMRRKFE
jgi:hypothetical protein